MTETPEERDIRIAFVRQIAILVEQRNRMADALKAIVTALDERSYPGRDAGRGAVYHDDDEAAAARAAIAFLSEMEGGAK